LTATQSGTLVASWYDGREANAGNDLNCAVGSPNPCYRRWGRVSFDNGATWQADDMVGRALSGLPAQPDGAVQATYEGDYDYHSSFGNTAIGAWTDGRTTINGNAQQDVFVNLVSGAAPTASPTPTPLATATPTATVTPAPPAAPTALSATNVTTNSFTANWSTVGGATGYLLDVATNNSFTNHVPGYQNRDVGPVNSWNVTGLTRNTFYYYRVRAYNANGTSPSSNVIRVKTKSR